LFAQNGFPFISYNQGDIFGDSDSLLGELRDSKAAAAMACTLHSLKMEDVEELLNQFPEVHEEMKKVAKTKRAKHAKKIA
jgi:signal-transduction protein with cAMP-binding, CBS, and nucleotidyltransferase domain